MSDIIRHLSVFDAVKSAESVQWRTSPRLFDTDEYNVVACAHAWRAGPSREQIQRIESWMDKIDASMHDRQQATWTPSPHGAYAVVPEFLSGEHFNMRQKIMVDSDAAPVTVWVELGLSHSFSAEAAEKRAAAIAALLAKLSETRPVEAKIIACSTVHGRGPTINRFVQVDIDAKILDASYIAQCLAMPEIIRPLRWAMIVEGLTGCTNIGFAFYSHQGGLETREKAIRETFKAAPQDIVIQAAIGDSPQTRAMIADPINWVHTQIEKQRRIEE